MTAQNSIQALFASSYSHCSDQLLQQLQTALTANSTEETTAALNHHLKSEARFNELQQLIETSEFSAVFLFNNPAWLVQLLGDGLIERDWNEKDYQAWFAVDKEMPEREFDTRLRRQRNKAMSRIIWRDFNRLANTQQTTLELSLMAESVIQTALEHSYHHTAQRWGTPCDDNGTPQPMLILGMGKLGAWELNLSSDIDLIFTYPLSGHTQGTKQSISNQEFFSKVGQQLIKSLDHTNADGFVFRVDMRLRPYGQSGALVSSFNALEDYYQTQGREWERFAMIKARIVAHNANGQDCEYLMSILRSFTYRRYVDFSAIDALRNLKQLINKEIRKKKTQDNVKIGRGGIREVEFIAQAFQIIRGGRDTELQERRVLKVLPMLETLHCLPLDMAQQLSQAYLFLRNVEHAIQGFQDRQTQILPTDDLGKARIAKVMGFPNWDAFFLALQNHRNLVHDQFNQVIASPDEEQSDAQKALDEWKVYWNSLQSSQAHSVQVAKLPNPEEAEKLIQQGLLSAPSIAAMSGISRERFDQLMPRLLNRLSETESPCETLRRLIPLLCAVARRSAYLLLLSENPGALNQLVLLTQASPWIGDQLAKHPALLDELLDPTSLYTVPPKQELIQELRQETLRLNEKDLEEQMETLRYFRSSHALRVAACEVSGRLPLMKVSDYLTELAEVILDYVLKLAWLEMVAKHGYPSGEVTDSPEFLIVGYGKLGGIELGHGSDLDLVFIHDADPQGASSSSTEGTRSLDNLTYFVRLGQKIIHILNAQTLSGQLYEVDMRLRPSGNSGLLVCTFSGFEKYQEQSAWTWEHQALVRARAICGSQNLQKKFAQLRAQILTKQRDLPTLAKDVKEMRQKMRDQLGTNKKQQSDGQFHLKQDAGGIVDIEFMVQYAVLAWSHTHPELIEYTDNIRILERLAATGQMSTQEVHQLIEAYKALRSIGHRLALQDQPSIVAAEDVEQERQTVTHVWGRLLESEQKES